MARVRQQRAVPLEVRDLPEAAHLGLLLPRVLMRTPYGRHSNPVERFDFEEITDGSRHEDYLWGNPAALAAALIADGFSAEEWDLRGATSHSIGGLPLHYFDDDGERAIKPCAEVALTERGGTRMRAQGLSPVWWVRDTDQVRLDPFISLATDAKPLRGPWR